MKVLATKTTKEKHGESSIYSATKTMQRRKEWEMRKSPGDMSGLRLLASYGCNTDNDEKGGGGCGDISTKY